MKRFKVYTRIAGGALGLRAAYAKDRNGSELVFETRDDAERYIAERQRRRSPHSSFRQHYEIHEEV